MKNSRWFWVYFPVLAIMLVARNGDLFSRRLVEEGDAAANSVLVINAKHFTQLVGNYSRVGFHHPGPAFLYVHALGEGLFYDFLRIVPAPFNGQLLAVLIFNAALIAAALALVVRRLDPVSWWPPVAVGGVTLLFLSSWKDLVASTWPPFEYFAPYLLLLVAAASVASGAARDLWALALAAGLLVNGHAEFLFLATLLVVVALAALLTRHRDALHWRHGAIAGGVLVLLLLPTAINTFAHWPGEFGKYLTYGGGHAPNSPLSALRYVVAEWDPSFGWAVAMLVLCFVAAALSVRVAQDPFVTWCLIVAGIGTVSFLVYAVVGIDAFDPYIGIFTRGLPLFLLAVTTGVATSRVTFGARTLAALAGAVGIVLAVISPVFHDSQPSLDDVPGAVTTLAERAPGQPVALTLAQNEAWAEALPLALEARRAGERVCFLDDSVALMATPAFICSPDERAVAFPVTVARRDQADPAGLVYLADLDRSAVWAAP